MTWEERWPPAAVGSGGGVVVVVVASPLRFAQGQKSHWVSHAGCQEHADSDAPHRAERRIASLVFYPFPNHPLPGKRGG